MSDYNKIMSQWASLLASKMYKSYYNISDRPSSIVDVHLSRENNLWNATTHIAPLAVNLNDRDDMDSSPTVSISDLNNEWNKATIELMSKELSQINLAEKYKKVA